MVYFLPLSLLLLLIHGCSVLPKSSTVQQQKVKSAPVTVSKPFEPETLYALLVAEIAGSRQQYKVTLGNYIRQAYKTQDIGVIARAARIAQFVGAHRPALEMGLLWLKHQPDSEQASAVVATRLIAMGRLTDALSYADNAVKDGDKPLFETIALHSRKHKPSTRDTLIKAYNELSAKQPTVVSIKIGLSILYMLQSDNVKALAVAERALDIDPEHIPAVMQRAKILHLQQKTELAIDSIRAALDQHPQDNRLRLLYARLLTKTDPDAAYQEFAYLSQQSPNQLDFKFSQALLALQLEDYETAQALLSDLYDKNYKSDDTAYYLGRIAENNRQFDQALTYYLQVSQGANFFAAHTRVANIMINRNEPDAVGNHFDELRKNHREKEAKLYAVEAGVMTKAQQHQLALNTFDEGIVRFPDDIALRYNRSLLYEKLDRVQSTEIDLRHILTLDPDNVLALNALGYFLTSYTERYQEALVMIEKALSQRPDDPAIMDSMGWVLFHLGEYQQALDYLRRALDKFPDGEIAAHLGEVLWTIGEVQEAKAVWSRALVQQPHDPRILKTLERLNVTLD